MAKRLRVLAAGAALTLGVTLAGTVPAAVADESTHSSDPVGELSLLSDPFLQLPGESDIYVVWMTEFDGTGDVVLVGDGVEDLSAEQLAAAAAGDVPAGIRAFEATTTKFSQLKEDAESQIPGASDIPAGKFQDRDVWRHEAHVTGLAHGEREPYRVVSADGEQIAGSGTFTLTPAPRAGDALTILLTSDHQAMVNTPANLQMAAETIGDIDAVFFAGDLVNVPDRASEWFDDTRGGAFFPVLQGNAGRASTNGDVYHGGEIIQHAPLYPAIGNHEVQGRLENKQTLLQSFNAPVPREIAEQEYENLQESVNPTDDPAVRDQWIADNSFSTTTYEEMFTLPEDSPGGETYYAVTVGDVRLVALYSTRIWRNDTANPDPAERAQNTRFQEGAQNLGDPLEQGYGEFIFEDLAVGSEQLTWLQDEVSSPEFQDARITIVMLHEGPQSLGGNVMPHFAHPERVEELDAEGNVIGARYEYPRESNILLRDVQPILEEAGTDLVYNGHNHVYNRFESADGVTYLENANTGNTYRAYHELSGNFRNVPPAPWNTFEYLAQGNPGRLDPIMPTGAALANADGIPTPFVQSNDHAVFAALNTATGEITSYIYDVRTPEIAPAELDRFSIATPLVTAEDTSTAIAAGAVAGDSVTLTATVTPAGAEGAVQFRQGDVAVGAPVAVDRGSASHTVTGLSPLSEYSFSAEFVPADPNSFAASTSSAITVVTGLHFTDVPAGHLFGQEISWMGLTGISTGWPTGEGTATYRPNEPTLRDAMAAFIHRFAALRDPSVADYEGPEVSPFTDVSVDHVFYDSIAWVHEARVATGWSNGDGTWRYGPNLPTQRDAMSVFLYRLGEYLDAETVTGFDPPQSSPFADVPTDHAFYNGIAWMGETGISTGWVGDGSAFYRPNEPTLRDAMAAFMHRYNGVLGD